MALDNTCAMDLMNVNSFRIFTRGQVSIRPAGTINVIITSKRCCEVALT